MAKPYRFFLAAVALAMPLSFAACSSAPKPEPAPGLSSNRQWELEQSFNLAGGANETAAVQAANQIALLSADEHVVVSGFWGRRSSSPLLARRIGHACMAGSAGATNAARAVVWYRRALTALKTQDDYVQLAQARLDLARAYHAAGDSRSAIELLVNRIDTRPLPASLDAEYRKTLADIQAASTARSTDSPAPSTPAPNVETPEERTN